MSAVRVAVVGPTHPFKGGVAAHTTELARHLAAAGVDAELVSWSRLYPRLLYPGQQTVPDGQPDLPPYSRTTRPLRWDSPLSWWRTGRHLSSFDVVVLVHVVPVTVPALLVLRRALRQGRPASSGPRVVVVAHNVLPHEAHPGDVALVARLLAGVDGVVVHTPEQASDAYWLGARRVRVASLPPHLPGGSPLPGAHAASASGTSAGPKLLALGLVREYKGLDILLEALARVPGPTLTIAGELWRDAGDKVRRLAGTPELAGRVQVRPGYVAGPDVPALIASHDALVLPYRSGTGTQNVTLAHAYGLPVLATRIPALEGQVRDGVDGVLVEPGSVPAMVEGLTRLAEPGLLAHLAEGVRTADLDAPWRDYLRAVLGAAPDVAPESAGSASPSGAATPDAAQQAAPPGGRVLDLAKRGAERALWLRVGMQRRTEGLRARRGSAGEAYAGGRWVPTSVPPVAVLQSDAQWQAAVAEARSLGLPLHRDRPKNWDALGAAAAVLAHADRGSRAARVLDAGSARYSPLLPWLRLYGLGGAPGSLLGLNLEFGATTHRDGVRFRYGDITDTHLGTGSLDAVTCLSVIEHGVPLPEFLAEAARVLRPGGVLVISTDYDADPPDVTGKVAYGVPVFIFGPDDVRGLVDLADRAGFDLIADLPDVRNAQRPVHWARLGLDYTFILLTFRRRD